MKYKTFIAINKIVLWTILLGTFAFAQTNWIGKYEFYEDGGKTAGGTAIFISHELKVEKDANDKLKAHLTANGYMTYLDIIADAKVIGNKLEIYFNRKGDENSMGFDFKKGDLLLVFEEKTKDEKPKILTYWEKYKSEFPKYQQSGNIYFERAIDQRILEKRVRNNLKRFRYVYIGRVKSSVIYSKNKITRNGRTIIRDPAIVTVTNRLVIEKIFKGTRRKLTTLKTTASRRTGYSYNFVEGERYLVYANSYRTFSQAQTENIKWAKKEIEILHKILAEKKTKREEKNNF